MQIKFSPTLHLKFPPYFPLQVFNYWEIGIHQKVDSYFWCAWREFTDFIPHTVYYWIVTVQYCRSSMTDKAINPIYSELIKWSYFLNRANILVTSLPSSSYWVWEKIDSLYYGRLHTVVLVQNYITCKSDS